MLSQSTMGQQHMHTHRSHHNTPRTLSCVPSTSTYTTIIDGCSRAGNTDLAVQTFEEMDGRGVVANTPTFTALISACGATGDMKRAFEALGKMRQTVGTVRV